MTALRRAWRHDTEKNDLCVNLSVSTERLLAATSAQFLDPYAIPELTYVPPAILVEIFQRLKTHEKFERFLYRYGENDSDGVLRAIKNQKLCLVPVGEFLGWLRLLHQKNLGEPWFSKFVGENNGERKTDVYACVRAKWLVEEARDSWLVRAEKKTPEIKSDGPPEPPAMLDGTRSDLSQMWQWTTAAMINGSPMIPGPQDLQRMTVDEFRDMILSQYTDAVEDYRRKTPGESLVLPTDWAKLVKKHAWRVITVLPEVTNWACIALAWEQSVTVSAGEEPLPPTSLTEFAWLNVVPDASEERLESWFSQYRPLAREMHLIHERGMLRFGLMQKNLRWVSVSSFKDATLYTPAAVVEMLQSVAMCQLITNATGLHDSANYMTLEETGSVVRLPPTAKFLVWLVGELVSQIFFKTKRLPISIQESESKTDKADEMDDTSGFEDDTNRLFKAIAHMVPWMTTFVRATRMKTIPELPEWDTRVEELQDEAVGRVLSLSRYALQTYNFKEGDERKSFINRKLNDVFVFNQPCDFMTSFPFPDVTSTGV